MNPRTFLRLLRQTFDEWNDDKAPRLGAALAYYFLFSIAPLLLIATAVAGLIYGEEAARGQVAAEISATFGRAGARAIEDLLHHTSRSGAGLVATLVGFATLLVGAAGGFWQLQDALNTVWKVAPRPGRGLLGIVRDRFLSFLIVLGSGLFLLGTLVATTALAAVSHQFTLPELPGGLSLWQLVNGLVSVLSITILFALIYKLLPDVRVAWGDVWFGSALTALLFTIGKQLIGLYLAYAGVASAFGAAGSLVLILLWVYYSSQIFLFGAEFIRIHALHRGATIIPTANAVLLTPGDLAREGIPRSADVAAAARRSPPG
jgi:membrane protein